MAVKKWKRDASKAIEAVKSAEATSSGGSSDYWKPALVQGQEKSSYVVRILPNPDSDDGSDWIMRKKHMISFPGGKYMGEPCPRSHKDKKPCPICEAVNPLFESGNPQDENLARAQFAKKRYYMNVYVIEDNRDDGANEGKVFIWECPKILMEETLLPSLTDENIMFSCPYEGANLKITIKKKGDFPDYGASRLMGEEPLGDDDEIEEIMEKAFNLNEKILGDHAFKSYEDLEYMYTHNGEKPSGGSSSKPAKKAAPPKVDDDEDDEDFDLDDEEAVEETPKKKAPAKKTPAKKTAKKKETVPDDDDDEDFDLDDENFDLDDDDLDDIM